MSPDNNRLCKHSTDSTDSVERRFRRSLNLHMSVHAFQMTTLPESTKPVEALSNIVQVHPVQPHSSQIDVLLYQSSHRHRPPFSSCFVENLPLMLPHLYQIFRIFEDKSADLTRQTYGDVRFDKSTI